MVINLFLKNLICEKEKGTSINDVRRFLAIFDLPTLISDVINGRSQTTVSYLNLALEAAFKPCEPTGK